MNRKQRPHNLHSAGSVDQPAFLMRGRAGSARAAALKGLLMTIEHAPRLPLSPLLWLTLDDQVRWQCQKADASSSKVSALAATILILAKRRPGTKVVELAHLTGVDQGQISRCAADLRARGLLVEQRGAVRVSEAGAELAAKFRGIHDRVSRSLLASLPAHQRADLHGVARDLAIQADGAVSSANVATAEASHGRSAVMLAAYIAAIVRRTYRRQLRDDRGLHTTDLRALEMLVHQPLPLFALAQAMSREISQLSRSIKRLEQNGLVSALHRATDLHPTEAGLTLLADVTERTRSLLCLRSDDAAEQLLSSALRALSGALPFEATVSVPPNPVFQSGASLFAMGRNVRGFLQHLVA